MAATNNFRTGDNTYDLIRKILVSLEAGVGGDIDLSSVEADLADLLAEMQLKTEPNDFQLMRGSLVTSSVEFTRPADTTAYASNDVVGTNPATVLTFADAARIVGGTGYITNVRLIKDETTITNALFRLWLYRVAPTPIADNAQFTLLYANRENQLGYVDLPCGTEGTGSDSATAYSISSMKTLAPSSRCTVILASDPARLN